MRQLAFDAAAARGAEPPFSQRFRDCDALRELAARGRARFDERGACSLDQRPRILAASHRDPSEARIECAAQPGIRPVACPRALEPLSRDVDAIAPQLCASERTADDPIATLGWMIDVDRGTKAWFDEALADGSPPPIGQRASARKIFDMEGRGGKYQLVLHYRAVD